MYISIINIYIYIYRERERGTMAYECHNLRVLRYELSLEPAFYLEFEMQIPD